MTANLKIIKYFVKVSPIGEVQDVLEDIGSILGSHDFLTNADTKQALRDFYEHHKQHIQLQDGRIAIVTQEGRQDPVVRYAAAAFSEQFEAEQEATNENEGEDAEQEQYY